MSTTALTVQPNGPALAQRNDHLSTIQRLGNLLSASGYFADVKDAAQAAVKVMAGEELGISPVASVMGIHIIKGKVTLSANLMAAMVRRHGYNYRHVQFDNKGCNLEFFDKSGVSLGFSSFTEEDARAASVFNDMYKKFPRNMYFSRAMSNGTKWYCPEVTSGLPVYVPEELGAKVNGEGEYIEQGPDPKERGSKEAAQEVAQRKLEEFRAADAKRREALEVGPHDIPIPLPPEEPPSELEQKLQESITNAKEQAEEKSRKELYFKDLQKVGALKKKMAEMIGDDELYYFVLGNAGYEHANEIPATKMVPMYKAIAAAFTDWKSRQEMPEGA